MADTTAIYPLEVMKIDDNTFRIVERTDSDGVYSLLFVGGTSALLVDTMGFGHIGSLKETVESITDKPVVLVNTHGDFDHTGSNHEFDEAHMHPAEFPYYYLNGDPGAKAVPIWENDVIDIGGRKFEVVLIPGHTPGSIALLDRENRLLISGDSISGGLPVFMFGEFRNFYSYIASMQKLIKMQSAFDTIYPAHGPFPLKPDAIEKSLAAAEKLIAGQLAPAEPRHEIPAKMYEYCGAAFYY